MVVGSHEHSRGDVFLKKRKEEIDKQIREIRAEMESLALKM